MIDGASQTFPINGPLWFIRDLIVIQLFVPLIYKFIKSYSFIPILVLGILWLVGIDTNIVGLNVGSVFFFSLGSYFSLNTFNYKKVNIIYIGGVLGNKFNGVDYYEE